MGTVDDGTGDGLRVTQKLVIPHSELTWRFTGSGGPGGQHANTANTKVDLRWDLEASDVLDAHQRQRLLARYGPELRVVESGERSQARNRAVAMRRLAQMVLDGLRVERRRLPTRPGRGAVERRLSDKRRRADTKRQRRPDWD
jgi:ribosome-associated protein